MELDTLLFIILLILFIVLILFIIIVKIIPSQSTNNTIDYFKINQELESIDGDGWKTSVDPADSRRRCQIYEFSNLMPVLDSNTLDNMTPISGDRCHYSNEIFARRLLLTCNNSKGCIDSGGNSYNYGDQMRVYRECRSALCFGVLGYVVFNFRGNRQELKGLTLGGGGNQITVTDISTDNASQYFYISRQDSTGTPSLNGKYMKISSDPDGQYALQSNNNVLYFGSPQINNGYVWFIVNSYYNTDGVVPPYPQQFIYTETQNIPENVTDFNNYLLTTDVFTLYYKDSVPILSPFIYSSDDTAFENQVIPINLYQSMINSDRQFPM